MTRVPRTPLQQAVGLLSRREHSQRELRRKLHARGAEPDAVERALARLAETGLQDERRFAESLVRQRVAAGYGPLYLRAELQTHALEVGLVAELIEGVETPWVAVARDLLARRYPDGVDDPRSRRRAEALLARRGFSADVIRAALAAR